MPRSLSPWDATTVADLPDDGDARVDAAVARAAEAFPAWSARGDRAEPLRALAAVLSERRAQAVDLLVREAGKCRADAGAEADLLARKIAITLDAGLARTPTTATLTPGQAAVVWRPRGVAIALGPSNFPLHLLHGLVVPALAVGCTVVAKPSERCPALGAFYHDCLARAGLAEVAPVVQGGAATAARLVDHPAVTTVAAVGSAAMGAALARRLAGRPEVVLALELGGVNHALVLPDADPAPTAAAIADGAWRMAGQRCTGTRIAHVPRAQRDAWLERLAAERARWRPAATPDGACGRMIDTGLRERFQLPYRALRGPWRLVAGDAHGSGCAADPLLLVADGAPAPSDPLIAEEHFGPALAVIPYDDAESAVALMRANAWRLAASVFTADPAAFAALAPRLPYGQVNHDRPTAGARSDLPFGGLGRSGNGRPAAVAACAIFADETVIWPA